MFKCVLLSILLCNNQTQSTDWWICLLGWLEHHRNIIIPCKTLIYKLERHLRNCTIQAFYLQSSYTCPTITPHCSHDFCPGTAQLISAPFPMFGAWPCHVGRISRVQSLSAQPTWHWAWWEITSARVPKGKWMRSKSDWKPQPSFMIWSLVGTELQDPHVFDWKYFPVCSCCILLFFPLN